MASTLLYRCIKSGLRSGEFAKITQESKLSSIRRNSTARSWQGMKVTKARLVLLVKNIKRSRIIEQYRCPRDPVPDCQSKFQSPLFRFHSSPDSHAVETILLETKYYSDWCSSHSDPDARLRHTMRGDEVFVCIAAGRDSLDKDRRRAFAMFNMACCNIKSLLQEHSLSTIYQFLDLFGYPGWWTGHADVQLMLLKFIHSMARSLYGETHPVSNILSLLTRELPWDNLLPQIGRLLLACTRQNGTESTRTTLWFQMAVVSACYIGRGELDLATHEVLHLSDQIQTTMPEAHELIYRSKQLRAGLYSAQADFLAAESVWLDVLTLSAENTGRQNASGVPIRSCWRLSRLYRREGRYAEAECYLRLALGGAIECWGVDDPNPMEYLKDLEQYLASLGKIDAVEQLLLECTNLYAYLDRCYLGQEVYEMDTEDQGTSEDNTRVQDIEGHYSEKQDH